MQCADAKRRLTDPTISRRGLKREAEFNYHIIISSHYFRNRYVHLTKKIFLAAWLSKAF
jgi:hypothetical protein